MYALDENNDPCNIRDSLDRGMKLCFEALAQDPPCDVTRGPWGTTAANQEALQRAEKAP